MYLVLLELPIDQQSGLFVHFLGDCVSHSVVGLQASVETCITVLVIDILLGVSGGWGGYNTSNQLGLQGRGNIRQENECLNMHDKTVISLVIIETINCQQNPRGCILLNDVPDIHFRYFFAVRVGNFLRILRWSRRGLRLLLLFLLQKGK